MNIIIATTKQEIIDHFMIRGKVFIIEQQIDWDIEFDGLDERCVLFNAYVNGTIVGAARLYHNKVGRVATLQEYRNQGIATALMARIEQYAKKEGISPLVLHAQMYVKDFYLHLGYEPVGEIFQEADIDHVKMVKEVLR